MAVVTLDMVQGHELREEYGSVEILRTGRITGLTASGEGQLLEAARDPGVPQLGQFYPNEIWFVMRRDFFPDGDKAARFLLTYSTNVRSNFNQEPIGNDGQDVKTFSASVAESTQTVDRDGVAMLLTPPAGWTSLGSTLSEAKVLKPVGALQFERTEASPPSARMRSVLGTLNNSPEGSYATGTLLCTRLDAQSDDGGRKWRVVYQFQYQPGGWEHKDRWKGIDGKVPEGATDQKFAVYPESNFGVLGLDFSDNQSPV